MTSRRLAWSVLVTSPVKGRLPAAVLTAAVLTAALLCGTLASGGSPARAASGEAARPASSCPKARGPFHVTGTNILGASGKRFVPEGITVAGLANPGYLGSIPIDHAKIRATAGFWCANTVRLQISQDTLVGGNGDSFSLRFLRAIEAEVTLAEKSGLVVVLNDQTEDVGLQPAPTKVTVVFWKDLSRVYGHDPQVMFDLFNQPRIEKQARCGLNSDWSFWRRGGRYQGKTYVGMQALADDVRRDGARNVLWVEGPCFANSLSGVGSHRISGPDVVYAFQHPRGLHDAAQWYADFGWVLFKHVGAVVDAEWTNYAANKSECWPDAPKAVPAYLRYLRVRGIGLTAYQLKKGLLIRTTNLDDPTHIYTSGPAKWRCAGNLDEGIGTDLLAEYRAR
jgi:Cellulase (glycosyl hydrolase family 5)